MVLKLPWGSRGVWLCELPRPWPGLLLGPGGGACYHRGVVLGWARGGRWARVPHPGLGWTVPGVCRLRRPLCARFYGVGGALVLVSSRVGGLLIII